MSGLTEEQRRASDPGRTAFVAASAGTGKTHVLIARLVRLMLTGTDPGDLLCLTFTKAAAAEMKTRLYRELSGWTHLSNGELTNLLRNKFALIADDDMVTRARRLFTTTLDLSQDLRIQTFHSFCQSILGRFPIESGLIPGFKAAEEAQSKTVMAEARDEALILSETNPAYTDAIQLLAEQTTEGTFQTLMDDVRQEQAVLHAGIKGYGSAAAYLAALENALGLDNKTRHDLIAAAMDTIPITAGDIQAFTEALLGSSKRDKDNGEILAGFSDVDLLEDKNAAHKILSNWLLTKDGKVKSSAFIMTGKLRDACPHFEKPLDAVTHWITDLQELLIKRQLADQSRALLMIGAQQVDLYNRIKQREGLVDFSDMVDRAVALISSADATDWIRFKLDQEITHILVDEAQDTNPDQWQVVNALAEEFFAGLGAFDPQPSKEGERIRTVFAVGDEKQSIFSFQGADPSQFVTQRSALSEKAIAAGQTAETIRMDTSFRSGRAVLELVDSSFAAGDPCAAGVLFDRDALRHATARTGSGGSVTLWPLIEEDPIEPDEPWSAPVKQRISQSAESRLASAIALDIQRQITRKEMLESKGRPLEAGDFLILVRRRKGFVDQLTRALEQLDLPVAGRDRMQLPEEMAVMDLMALARAALLPDDDLTLATVLKGPFIGLDENQLFDLAYGRGHQSLFSRLAGAADDDLKKAHDRFNDLIRQAEQMDVAPYFRDVLERQGGRAALLARLGDDSTDPINAFIEAAENYDRTERGSLLGFLQQMDKSTTDLKRDMEGAQGAIRIMTAHASKGLQAPVVYLADTTSLPDTTRDKRILTWQPNKHKPPLLLWTSGIKHLDMITKLKAEKDLIAREEYNRLLYVALTRAEDKLVVTGIKGSRDLNDACWYLSVQRGLDRLERAQKGDNGQHYYHVAQTVPVTPPKPRITVESKVATPPWLTQQALRDPDPKRPMLPSQMPPAPRQKSPSDLLENTPRKGSAVDKSMQLGTIIHQAFEWLPGVAEGTRATQALQFFKKRVEPDLAADLADKVMAVFAHADLQELMSDKGQSEVGLSGRVAGENIVGRIDRLLILDREIVFADFKTGTLIPDGPDNVPRQTHYQMALYARVLRKIYPSHTLKPLLIYTQGPRVIALDPDWLETSLTDLQQAL